MTPKIFPAVCALFFTLALAGCSSTPPGGVPVAQQQEVAALAQSISALGPKVDPEEAARAAQIAYSYSRELSIAYGVTDSALIHNIKVNQGLRPRGLCWHWAQDMQTRLNQERFKTLQIHRAIANSTNIRIEHSTSVISQKGDDYTDGIVLDPWRYGGVLFWKKTLEDPKYKWLPQADVLEKRRVERLRKAQDPGA